MRTIFTTILFVASLSAQTPPETLKPKTDSKPLTDTQQKELLFLFIDAKDAIDNAQRADQNAREKNSKFMDLVKVTCGAEFDAVREGNDMKCKLRPKPEVAASPAPSAKK